MWQRWQSAARFAGSLFVGSWSRWHVASTTRVPPGPVDDAMGWRHATDPSAGPRQAIGGPPRPTSDHPRGATPRVRAAGRSLRSGPWHVGSGLRPTARASRWVEPAVVPADRHETSRRRLGWSDAAGRDDPTRPEARWATTSMTVGRDRMTVWRSVGGSAGVRDQTKLSALPSFRPSATAGEGSPVP